MTQPVTIPEKSMEDVAHRVAGDELRQFVSRIENLEREKQEAADAIKEVYAELKARGYDGKVMRKLIALRKRNRDDVAEENAILSMYVDAVGYN